MQRSKPESKLEKRRRQQGENDEQQKDDLTRQQEQDNTSPRRPDTDPDILEEHEARDVETDRVSRKPKVDDEPR
jgi:hypothetical protein